jgi:hypothetical protein
MRSYLLVLFLLGGVWLVGCNGPTSPLVPLTAEPSSIRGTAVPALEPMPTAVGEPTAAVSVAESYPAPPTVAPDSGYPPPPPALPTSGAYPPPDQPSLAEAHVTFVRATQAADKTWTLEVTIEHPNRGDGGYADGWDIITPAAQVIKKSVGEAYTQALSEPSTREESLTHTLTGLAIPADVTRFFVRAHDSVHGWGGEMVFVDLTTAEGLDYEVARE